MNRPDPNQSCGWTSVHSPLSLLRRDLSEFPRSSLMSEASLANSSPDQFPMVRSAMYAAGASATAATAHGRRNQRVHQSAAIPRNISTVAPDDLQSTAVTTSRIASQSVGTPMIVRTL